MGPLLEVWEKYKAEHPSADKASFYAGAISVVNLLNNVPVLDEQQGREMAGRILSDLTVNAQKVLK